MSKVQLQVLCKPSGEMLRAAAVLDQGVGHLLASRKYLSKDLQQYESSNDALNLLYLAVRHIEAVATLARTDVALDQPATSLARSVLEISVRALWMVDDNDTFRRERRWLVLTQEEIRARQRVVAALKNRGEAGNDPMIELLEKYVKDVNAAFPAGYPELTRVPSAEQMIREVNLRLFPGAYEMYVLGSQIVHGTLWSANKYRGGLGTKRKLCDQIDERSWFGPMIVAGVVILDPLPRVLRRLGVPAAQALPDAFRQHWQRIMDAWREVTEKKQTS